MLDEFVLTGKENRIYAKFFESKYRKTMKKSVLMSLVLLAGIVFLQSCSSDDDEELGTGGSSSSVWNGTTKYATYDSSLADNTVQVVWNDSATVVMASNLNGVVSAEIRGGAVVLLADESLEEEVTYTLSGVSARGSLWMDGSYKATFVLNGLTLTSADSAAINIRDGKRINVELADGTVNTLSDAKNGTQKACMMVKGHTEFSGGGSLTLTGNTGHAFWGKEYVQIKASVGKITVKSAVGDGFNVNEFFQMNGGTLDISGVGDDGIQVSYKTDDNDNVISLTEDEDNTGEVLIKGGTLTTIATASGARGIKTEGNITINEDKGTVVVTATSSQHEGMEAKGTISISAGTVYVQAKDDAINSGGDMTISGGMVCAYSTGNDGLDANGNCYIQGGTVYAIGASQPEVGIDANTEKGYKLYVPGGTIVAIGGLESGSSLTQSCYQASWNRNTWYALYNGDDLAFIFKTPSSGGTNLVVSTASTPSLKSGVSVSDGTEIFSGLGLTGGSVSGGSSVSLSAYSSGGNGGHPGGWH